MNRQNKIELLQSIKNGSININLFQIKEYIRILKDEELYFLKSYPPPKIETLKDLKKHLIENKTKIENIKDEQAREN